MFKNRTQAGKLLAVALAEYKNSKAVIFALPRGGVVVGYEVATTLGLPLDIVVTRKIGHPDNPEYAICAVDAEGLLLCDETEVQSVDKNWFKEEISREREEAKRRVNLYRGKCEPEKVKGKVAIIIDDGIATGLTMRLAIRFIKKQNPEKIVVAVPVAPAGSIQELKKEGADEVITVEPPGKFLGAIGAHYSRFEQVEDREVMNLLADLWR